jgi:hypothetical protein
MWSRFKRSIPNVADRDRVKGYVQRAIAHNPDVGISVSEIACTDPACPGTETVILIMVPGKKTAATKVPKPLDSVTEDDVRDALRSLA